MAELPYPQPPAHIQCNEREQYTDSLNYKEEQRLEAADNIVECMVNLMNNFVEGRG